MAEVPRMVVTVDVSALEAAIKEAIEEAIEPRRELLARAARRLADLGECELAIELADAFEIKTREAEPEGDR